MQVLRVRRHFTRGADFPGYDGRNEYPAILEIFAERAPSLKRGIEAKKEILCRGQGPAGVELYATVTKSANLVTRREIRGSDRLFCHDVDEPARLGPAV